VTVWYPAPPQEGAGDWLGALARVMARVTANADREGVLHALTAGLVEEFGVALARIWLYDPADDTLHLRASSGLGEDSALPGERIAMSTGTPHAPIARAVREQRVVVIDPITPTSGFGRAEWFARHGLRFYAGFPLLVGERVTGALAVFLRSSPPAPMLSALEVLARQAALALEHARLLEESQTLQHIAARVAAARDTDMLLHGLVEWTMAALGADGCAVWLLDDTGALRAAATRGLSDRFRQTLRSTPQRQSGVLFEELRRTGQPLFTADDQAAARQRDPALGAAIAAEGIVSALRLPLFDASGTVMGMLALYHRRQRLYSEGEVRLAQAFANQVGVALQNTRLVEKERAARRAAARQVERLAALAQITEQLLASSGLETVLRVVVAAARRLCDAPMAMVALADPDRRLIRAVAAEGELQRIFEEEVPEQEITATFLQGTATGRAFATGRTVVVEDYTAWPVVSEGQARTVAAGVRALVVSPLRVGGTSIGVLWVGDTRARRFDPDDVPLIEALANQAALAIEHARLEQRSHEAVVLEERARLARDLHDSVTQSLFSLGMLARAAKTQHEKGAPALAGTLERIGTLAQQALTEMRALLFELRPSVLAEEGLAAALERLTASYRVRFDLPVRFVGSAEADVRLPDEVETALFRIAQEALNNAAKHAHATEVVVTMTVAERQLCVMVEDNGRGFDIEAARAAGSAGADGGMGMRTMRERATAAGITLRITGGPGRGTRVWMAAPLPADEGALVGRPARPDIP